MLHQIWSWRG